MRSGTSRGENEGFREVDQDLRERRAIDAVVVAVDRADEGPVRGTFERVGHDVVCLRVPPRCFGDRLELASALAHFELEFDEEAAEPPGFADEIDKLRRAKEPQ